MPTMRLSEVFLVEQSPSAPPVTKTSAGGGAGLGSMPHPRCLPIGSRHSNSPSSELSPWGGFEAWGSSQTLGSLKVWLAAGLGGASANTEASIAVVVSADRQSDPLQCKALRIIPVRDVLCSSWPWSWITGHSYRQYRP